MEDNSPECIAANDAGAEFSRSEDGRRFVEENFTFERVVERWKEVLEAIWVLVDFEFWGVYDHFLKSQEK